jgi:hypothetical protein
MHHCEREVCLCRAKKEASHGAVSFMLPDKPSVFSKFNRPEAEVDNLSRRLESIEQRLGNTDSISPSISHSVEDSTQENLIPSEVLPVSRPDSPPPPENGTDCKPLCSMTFFIHIDA